MILTLSYSLTKFKRNPPNFRPDKNSSVNTFLK